MDSLGTYIPELYLDADADGSLAVFIGAYDEIHGQLIAAIETIPQACAPRLAPVDFQSYIADHHGNPFPFMTNERWADGFKAENLTYIYSLRGTATGLVAAINYLCGIQVEVLQNFQYCWELGVSQLGAVSADTATGFGSGFGSSFGS